MPSVETICSRQWDDPAFRQKWLVGGIIASIPLINVLFLGYALRYVRGLRNGENLALPDWSDWRALLLDGLKMLGLGLIYLGIPMLIGLALSAILGALFHLLGLHLFAGTIAVLPFTAGIFIGWLLLQAGIQHFLKKEDWRDLLNWERTGRICQRMLQPLLLPSLAYSGLMALGWPLLGFTIFLGLMPFLAYSTAVYLKDTGAIS